MPEKQPGLPMSEDELERNEAFWSRYARIPAWYKIAMLLGGDEGDTIAGSVNLRPEPFVLKRITWACTGDAVADLVGSPGIGSVQGRSVTVDWSDEFTKFFGSEPMLVSSVFADSQGFLDLPRGIIFSGRQTLSMRLTRLFWPGEDESDVETQWHFVFGGYGLIRGEYQSGSAG
jgi:hypothetical protein